MDELFLNTSADSIYFTTKDVIYFTTFVVSLLTAWFKLKNDNDKQTDKIKELSERADRYYNDCKAELMNAKNGRVSIRRDTDDKIKVVQEEVNKNRDTFNSEISNINNSLTAVKTDTAEIKGMISTLLNNQS
jgi:hypothetical protein